MSLNHLAHQQVKVHDSYQHTTAARLAWPSPSQSPMAATTKSYDHQRQPVQDLYKMSPPSALSRHESKTTWMRLIPSAIYLSSPRPILDNHVPPIQSRVLSLHLTNNFNHVQQRSCLIQHRERGRRDFSIRLVRVIPFPSPSD